MRHGKYKTTKCSTVPPAVHSIVCRRLIPTWCSISWILFYSAMSSRLPLCGRKRPSRAIDFCRNQVKTLLLPPVQRGELSGQMLGLLFLSFRAPTQPNNNKKMPGWRKRLKDQTPTIRCRFPLFTFFLFSPPKLTLPWLFGIADLFFDFRYQKEEEEKEEIIGHLNRNL